MYFLHVHINVYLCISGASPGRNSDEPRLSQSGLAQCKLLVYRTLVKHYSHTDRAPLLPPHMTDVWTVITDLLVNAKLDQALEALQLCLKLLPPSCRDELCRLLTFMCLAADPQGIKLDKEMENRLAVKRSFSRAIIHSKALSKEKEDLIVCFMLSNVKEIFKIPGALHKGVSDKLADLVHGTHPDVTGSTFCQQVSSRTYSDTTKETTNQELWALLNSIHGDTKISAKERKRRLGQFYQAHPQIFNQYFVADLTVTLDKLSSTANHPLSSGLPTTSPLTLEVTAAAEQSCNWSSGLQTTLRMPKEGDHLEGGGDKEVKEESTQEASEETVRADPPGQLVESSPQASPPMLVSVEELMETASKISNMALAHEIVVNQAFQLKPDEPPEGSLKSRVKEIIHKAFWDCLEAQLKEDPPSYEHAIRLLAEIKEILLSFLLPDHSRQRARIEEVLDLPLIQQQAENGALDIGRLSHFIVWMMGSLCAPSRDEDINKLREITDIVPLFKAIFSVLDLMKMDMANFALSSIRPHLMQQSVEYERNKFQEFLEKQPNALDYTEKWLEDTVKSLREVRADGSSAASSDHDPSLLPLNVHNHAFLRLLKWDHASDLFPEARFQEMQQEVDRLVLLSAVLLIAYTTAGDAISGLPGLMDTLKNTINVMLADMDTQSFSEEEALATIGEKLCVELSQCLSQHGYPPFSADQNSILKGQISALIQPDNTVRKLMDSRIQTYLLASLESSQHKTPPPLPGGLSPVSRELKELAVHFSRLVNHNKLVYSPFYKSILQKILTAGGGPSTET
ncbi:hypothetical protein INR49_005140 [Caranx melampygus]|nr:hypothetical protein INR49_005140 [Caranx melampygus]